jgi:hypothetical protein
VWDPYNGSKHMQVADTDWIDYCRWVGNGFSKTVVRAKWTSKRHVTLFTNLQKKTMCFLQFKLIFLDEQKTSVWSTDNISGTGKERKNNWNMLTEKLGIIKEFPQIVKGRYSLN